MNNQGSDNMTRNGPYKEQLINNDIQPDGPINNTAPEQMSDK